MQIIDWSRTGVHIGADMGWSSFRAVLAGVAALALMATTFGPCHCVSSEAVCHHEARQADAHGCCEEPAGTLRVSGECCDAPTPDLVMASPDISKGTPSTLHVAHVTSTYPRFQTAIKAAARSLPPLPLDRTTVLLI